MLYSLVVLDQVWGGDKPPPPLNQTTQIQAINVLFVHSCAYIAIHDGLNHILERRLNVFLYQQHRSLRVIMITRDDQWC